MVETIMDKNVTTVISEEEREKLTEEIINLLNVYDYHPTKYGVHAVLDEWQRNNGWIIELMKKHPNYVEGKYMIAFDVDYDRKIDKNCINAFLNNFYFFIKDNTEKHIKPYKFRGFTYSEIRRLCSNLSTLLNHFNTLESAYYCVNGKTNPKMIINGKTEEEFKKEYIKFSSIKREFDNMIMCGNNLTMYEINFLNSECFTKEEVAPIINIKKFMGELQNHPDQFVSAELAAIANKISDKIRAKEGQKTSRLINKICKLFGFDKTENYNQDYAAFADAINPLRIKRHTIISCNPVDYFTMSFGNSWSSCHTIDKKHERNDGSNENYEGMYSGGTLSYMLDNSSVVFYTVDKDYDGIDYELQDKINRCMFHLGEDKLIQGRVYPQSNDGENSIYKTIREIAQKVFADCLDVPNLWSNYKGAGACCEVIISDGCHYKDYANYSSCNVSYLTREENGEEVNKKKILIGHDGICPCCGEEHREESTIECRACYTGEKACHGCGYTYDEEDLHEIDGEFYCEDCCFYCDFHGRWEIGTPHGNIGSYHFCEDALTYENISYCEYCEEYFWTDEGIETTDGRIYCSERCARGIGYIEIDGEWYPRNELAFCDECQEYVLAENYNSEHRMCNSCYEESQESSIEYATA